MSLLDASCVGLGLAQGLRPEAHYSLPEWADNFRTLSSKSSAEPGRWRTSRTPYLHKIMDCLSTDSPYQEIVFMAGSQVGKSECGMNWIGYIIDKSPAPILLVQPTVDLAKKFSQQRIDPMIEATEVLRGKVADKKSRESGNTVLLKSFEGGLMLLCGANSPTGLRSMPIRFLFLDEIDAYPDDAGGEGDPVDLATKRTATFSKRKIFKCSTPTTEELSKISRAYNATDQNRYFVPCPECGEMQVLKFENLTYDKDEAGEAILSSVRYACTGCGVLIPEHKKTEMLLKGEWRATKPSRVKRRTIGFHISSLYSPVGWYSWASAVEDFHKAEGNVTKMKTFVNTVLGETWQDKGDAPDHQKLYDRRENYRIGTVPQGGVILTAAVDVQKDRFEVEFKAWGRGLRSWSVDYRIVVGDTQLSETWALLEPILNEEFTHESGVTMRVAKLAVDSGFNTQRVYNWTRNQNPNRVMAVKGSDSLLQVLSNPRSVDVRTDANGKKIRIRNGARLYFMGSSLIKHEIYAWLRAEKPKEGAPDPYGFARFPQYGEEFFEGLASEQLVKKKVRGFDRFYWVKIKDRNEPLDLFVMNRACAYGLGLDRWKSAQWDKAEGQFPIVEKEKVLDNEVKVSPEKPTQNILPPAPVTTAAPAPVFRQAEPRRIRRRESSFL